MRRISDREDKVQHKSMPIPTVSVSFGQFNLAQNRGNKGKKFTLTTKITKILFYRLWKHEESR